MSRYNYNYLCTSFFHFQVFPVRKNIPDVDLILSRQLPYRQQCIQSASPSQLPHPINKDDVVVDEFSINDNILFLNVTWSLPEATYGEVTKYGVRVLHMPVNSSGMTTLSNVITEREFTAVS